jgi:hypothetical protein
MWKIERVTKQLFCNGECLFDERSGGGIVCFEVGNGHKVCAVR